MPPPSSVPFVTSLRISGNSFNWKKKLRASFSKYPHLLSNLIFENLDIHFLHFILLFDSAKILCSFGEAKVADLT